MPSRVHTSRGGAGNVASLHDLRAASATATTTTTTTSPSSTSNRKHFSGRGGAGNFHSAEHDHAIFAFDEELDMQLRHAQRVAPVIHVGRGGAGNVVSQKTTSARSSYSPGWSVHRWNYSSGTGSVGSRTSSEFERDEKVKTATKTTATTIKKTSSSSSSRSSSDTGLKEPQLSRWSSRLVCGFRS